MTCMQLCLRVCLKTSFAASLANFAGFTSFACEPSLLNQD